MDPITGVGAAASVAQLLALCIKSSKATKELWESYSDAPDNLRLLAEKIDTMKDMVEQVRAIETHLSAEQLDDFLPTLHRGLIVEALGRASQLEKLKSLRRNPHTLGSRMRWALLDESRAARIIKAVTDTENGLNRCLFIMQS